MTTERIAFFRARAIMEGGSVKEWMNECLDEIERLNKVLKLTNVECVAGGFVQGLAIRPYMSLDDYDKEMLVVAGKCIARIINRQEAKP
jgi:hypothetical protein